MSEESDLITVINGAALIENIINQIIEAFCEPRQEPFMFFWNVILDSSIMPMGSKVRVVAAIAQEVEVKVDGDSLHRVLSLRNAFAHHKTGSHPVAMIGKKDNDGELRYRLQVLSNSGTLSHKGRQDALDEFNLAFSKAKASLVLLRDKIQEARRARGT